MRSEESEIITVPEIKTKPRKKTKRRPLLIPQYNVILIDDDDHTYDYVIEMLMHVFGHSIEESYIMACEVDFRERVIVFTTSKEKAAMKKDEILNFGPDHRLARSKGSMNAIIEPAGKK